MLQELFAFLSDHENATHSGVLPKYSGDVVDLFETIVLEFGWDLEEVPERIVAVVAANVVADVVTRFHGDLSFGDCVFGLWPRFAPCLVI